MKYRAEVIVYDKDNETVAVLSTGWVGTIVALKHVLYGFAFRDLFGENKKRLDQWKADNYIKTRRNK